MAELVDDYDFEGASSGAAKTFPMQCSALRKNGFVMIKSRPCKIVEMSTSKTGKHGHAKVHFVAIDIFTGKKLEDICPSTHSMDVPNVIRREYEILDIDENNEFLTVMSDDGSTREDLTLPNEMIQKYTELREKSEKDEQPLNATVVSACDEEQVLELKIGKASTK